MKKQIAVVLCIGSLMACRDDVKEANRKAEEARIEADFRSQEAVRTASEKARNDRIAVEKRDAEHALAVATEKSDARSNVEQGLNSIGRRIAELQRAAKDSKNADEQRGLLGFKATLEKDLGEIERANDADWPSIKTRVEKDVSDAKTSVSTFVRVKA